MTVAAFGRLGDAYHSELQAHCYRMLGSIPDADEVLQQALLSASHELGLSEDSPSLRSLLYRVTTMACIDAAGDRQRLLSMDFGPAFEDVDDLGDLVDEPVWLDPYPETLLTGATDRAMSYDIRESLELAFVAALQFLPANQRAVLLLADVLAFSAAQTAELLDISVHSATTALQCARKTLQQRAPDRSQQATLRSMGRTGRTALSTALVRAWETADLRALLDILSDDVRFTMPPLPAWFDGKSAVALFLDERVFATPWRVVPTTVSGQMSLACYQGTPGGPDFLLGAVNVLTIENEKVTAIDSFLDPAILALLGLPDRISA
ncbi:RNA polymerase subunit sigma-70 [Antrihabitans sp. YC2-6]|uniref:RNA polymerase subunit sigma-70 n=1 Tax=Antrihabitans sp. YC2-6 TaxID=2799498 RepID=UPI0018F6AC9B|nr:RNA polymerase subunit sigma-70 [Antrihabitans sp. YC2-6]MBJ8344230.1 RNA polymerase subunit sigma-70 [Antrihabitans sp. YC2-6]